MLKFQPLSKFQAQERNIMATKLSKKNFLAIQAGGFLASNVMKSRKESIFAEVIASSMPDKELQWGRIVSAGADQRLFHVFRARNEYEAWLSTFCSPQKS
jgi:hypothetical protein